MELSSRNSVSIATYFKSNYENFMSPLAIIGNFLVKTYAVPIENPGNNIPVDAQGRVVNQNGTNPIVLTYYNLGNAKVSGVDAGITAIEATSFVSPKAVPQLADADEVFPAIRKRDGVRYITLVPNPRGLDRAIEAVR